VNNLDNRTVLSDLSGTSFVGWQKITFKPCSTWQQIYCDDKETSCWIDHNWMIGSSDDWWPTFMQYLRRYERNRGITLDMWKLAKWLKETYPRLEDKKPKKFEVKEIKQKEKKW
jgi:hypothetical protein